MTDKPIIYYKKDCFNEPYCSLGKVIEQLDQLKAENEECIKDNEYLKTIIKNFTQEVIKLKATLAEIKEIAKEFCNTCQEFETEKKNRNCMYCNYDDILQKISECEV